jgi:hypothetical protein
VEKKTSSLSQVITYLIIDDVRTAFGSFALHQILEGLLVRTGFYSLHLISAFPGHSREQRENQNFL